AVRIDEDLHVPVPPVRQKFFQKHARVAKRRPCFTLRFFEPRLQLRFVTHHAHPAPATTHRGLHHHRVPNFGCYFPCFARRLHRFLCARQNGDTRRNRQPSCRSFISQQLQQFRRGSNERNSRLRASSRKRRILRQKPVSRMNRIHAFGFG